MAGASRQNLISCRPIALDPDFAQPHAALAFCYGGNRMNNQLPAAEALAKGHAEAARALELDDQLAEAHASLGMMRHRTEYDWAGAERSFKRAVSLNPGYPEGLVRYGELLYLSGRVDGRAGDDSPGRRAGPLQRRLSRHPGLRPVQHASIRRGRRTSSRERGNWTRAARWRPGAWPGCYAVQRRDEQAIAAYLAALRKVLVPDRAPEAIVALEAEYRQRGWDGFARKELELAEEGLRPPRTLWRAGAPGARHLEMAGRYLSLGETDRAVAALEAAYDAREGTLVCVKADPRFDSLHADPRFQDLVRRVGIPP